MRLAVTGRMLLLALAMVWGVSQAAAASGRVVSMNVCTDQLAMLLARPGQLVSVSYLARDPGTSVLAEEAKAIPVNHGMAEEVFLLSPDLVLAGTYTTRTTVSLLRRVGVPVEEFQPESTFEDIRQNLLRMGRLLGNEERARELVAGFNADIAAASAHQGPRPVAAPLYANSMTSGRGTLVAEVLEGAGYENLGSRLGLEGTIRLPLELLVLNRPDLMMRGDSRWDAPAMAEEVLDHPALRRLAAGTAEAEIAARFTVCGTPFTASAVRLLAEKRRGLNLVPSP
ncbi:MAG: ABC transporter substrate-binding protein [Parvibaculaceae bacterium]